MPDYIQKYEFDVCILGSGMAGSTLAIKLASTNKSVILIEAGGIADSYPNDVIKLENVGQSFNLERLRSIQLGGTTNLWHNVLTPLTKEDFLEKKYFDIPGWPITYEQIKPFYQAACTFFNIGNLDEFENPPPKIRALMDDLNHNKNFYQNIIYKIPKKIFRAKDLLIKKYINLTNKHIILNATALKLVCYADSAQIKTVLVGTKRGFKKIKAKVFVSCLGGLETPRLLLNSARGDIGVLPNNLNIGRYLMDHPMGFIGVAKIIPPRSAPLFSDVYINERYRYRSGLGLLSKNRVNRLNHNLYIRPNYTGQQKKDYDKLIFSLLSLGSFKEISINNIYKILSSPSLLYRLMVNKYILNSTYYFADLLLVTEQEPNPLSKVTLSSDKDHFDFPIARSNWFLSEKYFQDVDRYLDEIKKSLFSDSSEIIVDKNRDSWQENFYSARHHIGTARMGLDSDNSVVNKDLKYHNVKNLFICDTSVFPSSGNANPSLTLVALSLRLSDHILEHVF